MVRAPEFPKDLAWLNVNRSLCLKEFRGRIVLLDFWTYGCINCVHSLPDLKYLEQKYRDRLTVLSVHSAKFENENAIDNIRQAILRYEIEHPVLVDRDFKVWESYAIRAYPTFVLIDPKGYIVTSIAGEGRRNLLDQLIQELIEKNEIEARSLQFALEKFLRSTSQISVLRMFVFSIKKGAPKNALSLIGKNFIERFGDTTRSYFSTLAQSPLQQ